MSDQLSSWTVTDDGRVIANFVKPNGSSVSLELSIEEATASTTALLAAAISASKKLSALSDGRPRGYVLPVERFEVAPSPDAPDVIIATFVLSGGLGVPLRLSKDLIPAVCEALQTAGDQVRSAPPPASKPH